MTDQETEQRRFLNYLYERFEPEPFSGCWLWVLSPNSYGYGIASHSIKAPENSAHRLSWHLHKGKIPNGLHVCHKCDTPACINPDHLFLGTALDNARDRASKGRGVYKTGTVVSYSRLHLRKNKNSTPQCRAGHIRTIENTMIRKDGYTQCLECNRIRNRRLCGAKRP